MKPYEMMLSESQERMLIILDENKEVQAKKIFDNDLDFVVIGKTTNSNRLILNFNDEKVADIPISALADSLCMTGNGLSQKHQKIKLK